MSQELKRGRLFQRPDVFPTEAAMPPANRLAKFLNEMLGLDLTDEDAALLANNHGTQLRGLIVAVQGEREDWLLSGRRA